MKRLKQAIIGIQCGIAIAIISFSVLFMKSDLSSTDPDEEAYIVHVRVGERYFTAALMFCIMVTLTVVDIRLLSRLKLFYPGFYEKEKKKVCIKQV